MTFLLESPLAVGSLGLVIVVMGAIPFFQTKSRGALAGLLLAVLLAIGGVIFERAYQTPRERVLATIDQLFDAIEANDLPGVLACLDPGATEMRADAEVLMPMFRVGSAGTGGEVRVEITGDAATARFKPVIKVTHKGSGAAGAYFDQLRLDLVQRSEEWLVLDYEAAMDWRQGAARLSK